MFEFHQGKSDKFWTIELSGNAHTVCYGRAGTDGQTKAKEFPDEAKARASYEKLIAQKTGKGYVEVVDRTQSRSAQVKAAQRSAKEQEPFLQEILKNPDDLDGYGVYADWLMEAGDPRGEFVGAQVRLEDESLSAADRKQLKKVEAKLLKDHGPDWLGDLAPHFDAKAQKRFDWLKKNAYQYTFARGFLDSLTVEILLPDFAKVLKRPQHARMLRRLVVRDAPMEWSYDGDDDPFEGGDWGDDDVPGLVTLTGAKFENLRHLEWAEDPVGCHLSARGIEPLIRAMPRLETLHLEAHHVDTEKLFKLKMPQLRSLTVHHLHEYPLELLAKNKSLTNLEAVAFHPHALEPGDDNAYIRLEGLRAICRSKSLTGLKHLELRSSDVGNEGIAELVGSPLLGQLKILDLTYGCITDEGAETLAGADLSGLDRLVLASNYITPAGIKTLRATGVNLAAVNQLKGEPDEEREHLWYGDME